MNDEAEKHSTKIASSLTFVSRKNLGIIFVLYSLYLAIVISIEIKIDRMISVFDITSIDDNSVILLSVVYGGMNIILIISRVIIGIKMCQYELKRRISGIDSSVSRVSSIY